MRKLEVFHSIALLITLYIAFTTNSTGEAFICGIFGFIFVNEII